MKQWDELLEKYPFIINDGAFATELEAMGCDINDELWSAKVLYEDPEKIAAVHVSYFEAGADMGTSASYQASVPGFMKKGFSEEESRRLIADSMAILKDAIRAYQEINPKRKDLLAAGSCGPYGAFLANGGEYTGDYGHTDADREMIRAFHKERMEILKDGGADLFACETVPALWEAKMEAELAKELGVPCWISFSCRNGKHISDGTEIAACAKELMDDDNIVAIGVNCTHPKYLTSLIREIRGAIGDKKPVIVYPNGGEEYDPVTKMWSGKYAAGNFRGLAKEWFRAGANVIGGCCRTTPQDIRELSALREEMMKN